MKKTLRNIISLYTCGACAALLIAQTADQVFKAAGTPADPKVAIAWDRYYDAEGIASLCAKIAAAHPNLAKLESIGKSRLGKELWCLTITDYSKGDSGRKPGIYIQGNIHGNEIQGAEFSLYTAWYLTESFADSSVIKGMLADKTFYVAPTLNPDARDDYMHKPNTANTPRGTPGDSDQNGFRDLDGDGNITLVRRPNPAGLWRKDPLDSRLMIPLSDAERSEGEGGAKAKNPNPENYDVMYEGGLDRDKWQSLPVDEDPNRDWLWSWDKTEKFPREPFHLPETRAARDFIAGHQNIAVALSMHNNGESIIRATFQGNDTENDLYVFNKIMKRGQQLLPGFDIATNYYMPKTDWKWEVTNLRGEEINWMFGKQGIYSFILELAYNHQVQIGNSGSTTQGPLVQGWLKYNDDLLFGDGFVPWHKISDPSLGEVEVGGWKKNFERIEPGFLIEADAHRAMAFMLYCAKQTPAVSIRNIVVEDKGAGNREITAIIANAGLIGTHSDPDIAWAITRPDWAILNTSGQVTSVARFNTIALERDGADPTAGKADTVVAEQTDNPGKLMIPNIPGGSVVKVRWIVRGGGDGDTVTVDSVKGGHLSVPVLEGSRSTPEQKD